VFWDVTASIVGAIALMMETVNTTETSVNFYQTTRRSIQKSPILMLVAVRITLLQKLQAESCYAFGVLVNPSKTSGKYMYHLL
jgi:hypothetical protein